MSAVRSLALQRFLRRKRQNLKPAIGAVVDAPQPRTILVQPEANKVASDQSGGQDTDLINDLRFRSAELYFR